jgi:hypothetical protein
LESRRPGLGPAGRRSAMLLRSGTLKKGGLRKKDSLEDWMRDAMEVISFSLLLFFLCVWYWKLNSGAHVC